MPSILVNRAPVLTLWTAAVAERLGHPADTALTLGRAVSKTIFYETQLSNRKI